MSAFDAEAFQQDAFDTALNSALPLRIIKGVNSRYSFKTSDNDNIVIGDENARGLLPEFTLNKWNNEARLRVIIDSQRKTEELLTGRVNFVKDGKTFRLYPIDVDDGGLEADVILLSQPASNIITL